MAEATSDSVAFCDDRGNLAWLAIAQQADVDLVADLQHADRATQFRRHP